MAWVKCTINYTCMQFSEDNVHSVFFLLPDCPPGPLPKELTGLSRPLFPTAPGPIVGGVLVLTTPAAPIAPRPDHGPVVLTLNPSEPLRSGGGPKVTRPGIGGVGVEADPLEPEPEPEPPGPGEADATTGDLVPAA